MKYFPDETFKPPVLALVGPTCSGKTALSLAICRKFKAEVVACDSRTVYRRMDIGTAKPSFAERKETAHHLIDVVDPDASYTVAQFKEAAQAAIKAIHARNQIPIVCGGTGFYARALLEGLDMPDVPPQIELRATLQSFAQDHGNEALHKTLRDIDPSSAARIHVNDRFRIVRALEVSEYCKRPFSQVVNRVDPPYRTLWIGLTTNDRNHLYAGIQKRFEKQIADGLLDEIESLLRDYGATPTILNTVNYREFIPYFQGQVDCDFAMAQAMRHNCNLAQKQLIWFRANKAIHWLNIDEMDFESLYTSCTRLIEQSQLIQLD